MLIYLRSTTSFRINAWPKASAAHYMFFTEDKSRFNLVPLIDYLSKCLYDIGRAFVCQSTFSLTNVVSPISGISYGINNGPSFYMMRLHPMTFTFAFTTRDRYFGHQAPRYRMNPQPHVNLWGHTLRTNVDFLTINVPKTVLRRVGINTVNMRELIWLYHFVGAFTKGFVERSNYYDPNGYEFRPSSNSKEQVLYASLPSLFNRYEYGDWIYSDRAWDMMPNVLHPSSATPEFCAFYCLNLRKWWKKRPLLGNVKEIERRVYEYLHTQVLRFLEDGVDDDGVVTQMRANHYDLPDIHQVELYVNKLLELP